jgi:hypothetical protein
MVFLVFFQKTTHFATHSRYWVTHNLVHSTLFVSIGTVVAITHDRYFLENSCSWILELDRGEAYPFEGNYSGWLEKKAERAAAEAKVSLHNIASLRNISYLLLHDVLCTLSVSVYAISVDSTHIRKAILPIDCCTS